RDEIRLVELHRNLVLLARLLRKPARREKVPEVVAQSRGARIRLHALLLFENPIVQGIPRNEVAAVERFLGLLLARSGRPRKERPNESGRHPESLHPPLPGAGRRPSLTVSVLPRA